MPLPSSVRLRLYVVNQDNQQDFWLSHMLSVSGTIFKSWEIHLKGAPLTILHPRAQDVDNALLLPQSLLPALRRASHDSSTCLMPPCEFWQQKSHELIQCENLKVNSVAVTRQRGCSVYKRVPPATDTILNIGFRPPTPSLAHNLLLPCPPASPTACGHLSPPIN